MENPVLKELAKKIPQVPDINGYVWVHMLIKYNPSRGAPVVVRSFTKQAKESEVKNKFTKKPKKPVEEKVVFSEESSEQILF